MCDNSCSDRGDDCWRDGGRLYCHRDSDSFPVVPDSSFVPSDDCDCVRDCVDWSDVDSLYSFLREDRYHEYVTFGHRVDPPSFHHDDPHSSPLDDPHSSPLDDPLHHDNVLFHGRRHHDHHLPVDSLLDDHQTPIHLLV